MTNPSPRVSIGLPVFNGEQYVADALDSILNQTFRDFELIICDNASTDRTSEICRAYAKRDSRIKYYRNSENLGAAKNFNRTFHLSSGEYFKWAAHDDVIAPSFIDRCVDVLDRDPSIVLCYPADNTIIGQDGGIVMKQVRTEVPNSPEPHERFRNFDRLLRGYSLFGLIRRDALARTPLIGGYASSDKVLLSWLCLRGRFHAIPEPLIFERDHPERLSSLPAHLWLGWFDSEKRERVELNNWRHFLEYLKAVSSVQMKGRQRAACYWHVMQWARKRWRRLAVEPLGFIWKHVNEMTKDRPSRVTVNAA